MTTTAVELANDLGILPEQVLEAGRRAGIPVLGERTALDDRQAARIQAVLRVPPQQWPPLGLPPESLATIDPTLSLGERRTGPRRVPVLVLVALVVLVAVLAALFLLG